MKISKWGLFFLSTILFLGCVPTLQQEVKLTINSEPPNAKIYEEGKLLGNTPLTISYKYECKVDAALGSTYSFTPSQRDAILSLLRSRSFTAMKDGFEPQTKPFQFALRSQRLLEWWRNERGTGSSSDIFSPADPSLLFILESERAKPQQQQQQQQQQTVVVMPSAGGAAKTYGALTIISAPDQADILVDGAFVAMTPVYNLKVEAGTHKIEIQKRGYKTWERIWQVMADSPIKIEVELDKI